MTIKSWVEFRNNLFTIFDSGSFNQVVLHESKKLLWADLVVAILVEFFKQKFLIACEFSHVRKYLSKSFNVTLFNSDCLKKLRNKLESLRIHIFRLRTVELYFLNGFTLGVVWSTGSERRVSLFTAGRNCWFTHF